MRQRIRTAVRAVEPIRWTPEGVVMLDQRRLPGEVVYHTYTDYREVAAAIKDMIIRGAPAIGVAAAMGVAIGVEKSQAQTLPELRIEFATICDTLARTRPTAVDLFWAIDRFKRRFEEISAGLPNNGNGALRHLRAAIDRGSAEGASGAPRSRRTDRTVRCGIDAACWPRDDAMQRRSAGHGWHRHGSRGDSHGGCRRIAPRSHRSGNASLFAGRAAYRLGTSSGRNSSDADHRQHGRAIF